MGFWGGVFKALGFEGDKKVKTKSVKPKATYNLNEEETLRPDEIDGVPVYYPESTEQVKEFTSFVKNDKAIIISFDACKREVTKEVLSFLKGFIHGADAKMVSLRDGEGLYLILPKGVEIEE